MALRYQFWQFFEVNDQYFYLDQLLFIDECGFTARTADRTIGLGLRGDRVHADVTGVRGWKCTGTLCIGLQGVVAFNLIDGLFDLMYTLYIVCLVLLKNIHNVVYFIHNYDILGSLNSVEFFFWFFVDVYQCMQPDPYARSVVVMDNHVVHKWNVFQQVSQYLGITIIYLPPYSPDLNAAAEEFFCALKTRLRYHRDLYQVAPKTVIRHHVIEMINFDIYPILDRIGYTFYCRH